MNNILKLFLIFTAFFICIALFIYLLQEFTPHPENSNFPNSQKQQIVVSNKTHKPKLDLDVTKCISYGKRKVVWSENQAGSYALNGQAISLEKQKREAGSPWLDSFGKEIKIGRDNLEYEKLTSLIKIGLKKCND